ncbi:MAG TPA: hypothetical protein VFS43_28915 [Polyangiaceae bacterium]|nr:hypothetical protein [Polyangiaceae bacterium]
MRVVHGSLMPLPADWPEFGELDGRRVRLADVESTLPQPEWANVVAVLDGRPRRPWRGVPSVTYDDDGNVVGVGLRPDRPRPQTRPRASEGLPRA